MSSDEINELANDYLRNLKSLLATDQMLLENLHSYKLEIIVFSVGLKTFQSVSTMTKMYGAVCVVAGTVLFPFTVGTSAGLIVSGTGAILSGRFMDRIRNFIDSEKTQEQIAKLRKYAEEHDKIANELQIGIVKLVDSLGMCATTNVTLKPTRISFVTMAFILQCGLLIPPVREYVQNCLKSSLSLLFPSIPSLTTTSFLSDSTKNIAVILDCLAAVCTIIECIHEFQEIFENHPSVIKAQSLIDAISAEIEQLLLRIELYAED